MARRGREAASQRRAVPHGGVPWRRLLGAAALAAAAWLAPSAAEAQSAALDRVEELARVGRAEEARAALTEWWNGARDDASQRDLQRGLWLRGRLTVDPVQAELDYQRLVVLYPNGPYTPQALFRLAQAAHANGDAAGADRHVSALVRDYPASPSRAEAEAWLRAAGQPPVGTGAPRASTQPTVAGGQPAAGGPGAAGATDPAPGGIRPSTGRPPAAADVALDWAVQFGAFSDEDRAFALQRELVAAGLAARLVRVQGSGFLHVRIGRFATREEAASQLEAITRQGFAAAIVRDDRAEEVVRR
jgi:cell division septation protein DedD